MRSPLLLAPLLLAPLLLAALPCSANTSADSGAALPCTDVANASGSVHEITCGVPASADGVLRVRARFSGGHDDTEASMQLTLNGQPVQCSQDSKTQLRFEEGDISLHCDFSARQTTGASQRVLIARVSLSHCQYEGFEFRRQSSG